MDQLDFSQAQTTEVVEVAEPAWATPAVLASIVALFALVAVSTRFAARPRPGSPNRWMPLGDLSGATQLVIVIGFVVLLAVQAVAAAGVWMHTRVVHTSAAEYFSYMSVARLLGTSHAHLFGYALLYGLIGAVATTTSASERVKAALVALLMWSGFFDVLSWWGIKMVSERFEWLSIVTAVNTAGASLAIAALVVRTLREGRR